MTATIRQVKLVPVNEALSFIAGQYIEFVVSEKELAPFSIANVPNSQGELEFIIREDKTDHMLQALLPKLAKGSQIPVAGPFGDCLYSNLKTSRVILLVGGVGIGQAKSMIEQAIADKDQREFHLYWGVSNQSDVFLTEVFNRWQQQLAFDFNICLKSETSPIQSILDKYDDLSACDVVSSGPWKMTDEAWEKFSKRGLPKLQMHSDRFAFL